MGDTRFRDGLAYGPYGNFFSNTANLFGQGDTTPDVTLGNVFFSNNTTNTTITHFDLQAPPGDTSPTYHQRYQGKLIKVIFLDNSTGLANAGRLILSSSDSLLGANNTIELLYHNSSWIEFNRSYNNSGIVSTNSAALGAAGIASVAGKVSTVRLTAEAGSDAILRRVTGGYQGQVITLIASGVSDALVVVNSAAADTFVTTTSQSTATQFRLMSSGAISFVRDGIKWLEIRPVSGNSSGQLQ